MAFPNLPPLSGLKRSEELFFSADFVSLADDVRDRIPGLSTSAAFFSSLRQNLHLHDAPFQPSPLSTPRLNPRSSLDVLACQPVSNTLANTELSKQLTAAQLQPSEPELLLSPSFVLKSPTCDRHDGPAAPLTRPAVSRADSPIAITCISSLSDVDLAQARSEALLLLKHCLARDQALLALRSLAMHPINIALLVLLLIVTRVLVPRSAPLSLLYAIYRWQAAALLLTAAGGIYWPLRHAAAEITRDLATACEDDEILVARWTHPAPSTVTVSRHSRARPGSQTDVQAGPVVGILILATRTTQTHPGSSSVASPRSSRSGNHHRRQGRGGSASNCVRARGSIRAWVVQPAYRGRGVGEALLRAAYAGVARRGGPGGEGGELGIAHGHAFSHQVTCAAGEGESIRGLVRVLGKPGGLYGGPAERRERAVRDKVRIVVELVREERMAEGRGRRNSGGKRRYEGNNQTT